MKDIVKAVITLTIATTLCGILLAATNQAICGNTQINTRISAPPLQSLAPVVDSTTTRKDSTTEKP